MRSAMTEGLVEAPGTAPGSNRFITLAVYRHSRCRQTQYRGSSRQVQCPSDHAHAALGYNVISLAGQSGTWTLTGNKFTAVLKRPLTTRDANVGFESLREAYPTVFDEVLEEASRRINRGESVSFAEFEEGCRRTERTHQARGLQLPGPW